MALLHSTMTLLHYTNTIWLFFTLLWLYFIIPGLYFTLSDTISYYHGCTSLYLTLPNCILCLYISLHHCMYICILLLHSTCPHFVRQWLYFTLTWFYITLYFIILFIAPLNSTALYHGFTSLYTYDSTSLFLTILHFFNGSTLHCFILPRFYFTLLDSTSFYHNPTSL